MYRIVPQTSRRLQLLPELAQPTLRTPARGRVAGLDRELMRKAIHLLVALVPPLASVHLHLAMGLLMAGTLFYTVCPRRCG